jgi:Family of unknown function (DUF5662)
MRHIERVRNLLNYFIQELLNRGQLHDQSKLEQPEVGLFCKYTPKLAGLTYGSPEYEAIRQEMLPALKHHYAKCRHHPEHFKSGIEEMNLVDIVELFCDWRASSERHTDGNIRKSIEHNANRFSICSQLVKILENTADLFDQ